MRRICSACACSASIRRSPCSARGSCPPASSRRCRSTTCSARCDMITVHVPLLDATRNLVNAARLRLMRNGGVMLNFARSGIVDEAAVLEALDSGKLDGYVCDFPTAQLKDHREGRGAAAPRRVDRRGGGELRRHGRGHAARFPGERQHPQLGQLPRGDPAAHRRRDAPVDRERERAEHGRPDLDRARGREPQHRRPAQQVARRARLHADRHRRQRARSRARASCAQIEGVLAVRASCAA